MSQRSGTASVAISSPHRVPRPAEDEPMFEEAAQLILQDGEGAYTRVEYVGVTEYYETTPDGFQWVYEWIFTLHP